MRLGGPVSYGEGDFEAYAFGHLKKGYKAAYAPGGISAGQTAEINKYKEVMKKHDIVTAEVGTWCNPLSRDEGEAKKNVDFIIERLALADELEACVCVNIIGTWHETHWFAPCADNFSQEFFDAAVEVYRKIIDAVKPTRTKMSFEIMPYCFLDSAREYERFVRAVDRKAAGVHFDPINCINNPRDFFDNAQFFAEAFDIFARLGVGSMHLKDLAIRNEPPSVMFDEVRIGAGGVDYVSLMRQMNKLPADTPAMLEHLESEDEYDLAAEVVRNCAARAGTKII